MVESIELSAQALMITLLALALRIERDEAHVPCDHCCGRGRRRTPTRPSELAAMRALPVSSRDECSHLAFGRAGCRGSRRGGDWLAVRFAAVRDRGGRERAACGFEAATRDARG